MKKSHRPSMKDAARGSEERLQENAPDPFPPEGTHEHTLRADGNRPLSEDERLEATRGFLKNQRH